jgi:hypothetical protein
MGEEKKEIKTDKQEKAVKKKSLFRKILRVVLWIFVGVIGLNLLLYILLSIPAVQEKVVGFAVDKLEEQLKTEVSIDQIRLTLWGDVSLKAKGIYIEDLAKDTLVYAHDLKVGISPLRLLNNKLLINNITLDDFVINVNQKDSASDFNFQFIIDAFAGDTTTQDDSSSSMAIVIKNIAISNGRLNYDVLSDSITPGMFNTSHIGVYDFKANLDLNSIDPENLDIDLADLSAKEKSGLEITSLRGKVYSKNNEFKAEGLSLSLPNSVLAIDKASYNMDDESFILTTQQGNISPTDLTAFMPELKNLRNNFTLDANVSGKLPRVDLENIELKYGEDMRLKGTAFIADYENYGDSEINLSIDNFKISPLAVNDFAKLGDTTFVAPDILNDLGDVFLKGTITGKLSKFRLNAETWAKYGLITLDGNGRIDTTFTNFDINAHALTKNFNLEKLLGPEVELNRLAMHIDLNANQAGEGTLNAEMQGAIDLLQYRDSLSIKNILFSGYYNPKDMGASLKAALSGGKLTASASMSQEEIPDILFDVDIDSLQVDRFYQNEAWKRPLLSLCLNGNIKGLDVDRMKGQIFLDSLDFRGDNFYFRPGRISLEMSQKSETDKLIALRSSILSANVSGYYTFMTLADELSDMMHNYMSNVFPRTKIIRKKQNNFDIDLTVYNTEKLGVVFGLPANIVQPASLKGKINTIDGIINLNGNIPFVSYDNMQIENTTIAFNSLDSAFSGTIKSKLQMENGVYNLGLNTKGADNTIHATISANNSDTTFRINGNIEAIAEFLKDERNNLETHLKVLPTNLDVGKLKLQMLPATVLNTEERTEIDNLGITFAGSDRKYIFVDGVISKNQDDSIRLSFDRSQVGDLLGAFNIDNIKAEIDGSILLKKTSNQPELLMEDFRIADIIIFNDTLGTFNLDSRWNKELGGILVNSYLEKSNYDIAFISGMVYPVRDSIDLMVDVDRFPIGWAQPFVSDMLYHLSGDLSMGMKIDGKLSAPHITGFFGANDVAVGVDYTNVTYHVTDTINISPDYIGFKNLKLTDSEGNQASANATFTHKDFKDMKYSLDMRIPQQLMVLNTMHRTDSMFYGKVYASGTVNIKGDDNGIDMNMKVKNGKNSIINIVVHQTSEAVDYKSVVYINVPEELKGKEKPVKAEDPLPIKMNMNIEITPDFQLKVLVDPATNTTLDAKGNGLVNFSYNMVTEEMNVFGDYTLQSGGVKLSLQKLKSFEFRVREGGKLRFVGDPMKTNFDITAYRRVRANLKTLSSTFEGEVSGRTAVDCVLGIQGNLDKMNLTYDVSLPDADEDTQRKVSSLINTDDEKIRQFAYLLATNSFYSHTGGGGNITDGMWTSIASSTLSGALNSMFSSILGGNWEVGTNIESNDGSFSDMDVSVNVGTSLFDDKLRLKTNVGYRNDAYSTSQSSFVGDFDVEYQLTKLWMLKAYSHTNDQFYRQAPTTQGVGIVYTKEAKTLKLLFQSFKPRRRNRNRQNTENNSNSGNNTEAGAQNKPTEQTEPQPVNTEGK